MAKGDAEFRVVLPAPKARPLTDGAVPQKTAERRFHRLLLVDDDDLVAASLTALLEMEGMAVLVLDLGRPVVEAVASFDPDAVILDLTLPDIDGIEVFRRLRGRWPRLPIVLSTGVSSSAGPAAELNDGRAELLRKPYEIEELLAALQRVATA